MIGYLPAGLLVLQWGRYKVNVPPDRMNVYGLTPSNDRFGRYWISEWTEDD